MAKITPDYEPSSHAYDLIYARINKAEAAAGIPESSRLSKGQIKVMMDRETDKMRLYFLTKYEKGKLISRSSWDLTWVNWAERHYENNRHHRQDSGSTNGDFFVNPIGKAEPKKAQPERPYSFVESKQPTQSMSHTDAFQKMREQGLIK